ncbi:MAG: hypothetical protein GKR94_00260 [Gammaproteobacteria bacterium]|nr:hypothetical protein [Gammaproteobacteria bacterium]
MTKSAALTVENTVALQVMQALLGLLSKDMRAISFEIIETDILLYFLHETRKNVNQEDIEDIKFELDVLTDGKYLIKSVHSDVEDIQSWPGFGKRLVFRRQ